MKTKAKKLKIYTLDNIKDEMIGKCGTATRDTYEYALKAKVNFKIELQNKRITLA